MIKHFCDECGAELTSTASRKPLSIPNPFGDIHQSITPDHWQISWSINEFRNGSWVEGTGGSEQRIYCTPCKSVVVTAIKEVTRNAQSA